MSICDKCARESECLVAHEDDFCLNYVRKPQTNADRIRAMTDEELAEKISGLESFALTCGGAWPPEKWLEWLRQEFNEGG